ncbi:putative reverse transcriptase domain-containing protein [Tanacetum coccineum]
MPPKSAPMTQADIRRMIKESVDAAIAAERVRQANVKNDASGYGLVRGYDITPAVREFTFAGFMKCNPIKVKFDAATLEGSALTWWKTKVTTMGLESMNQMPWTEMKQLMTVEFCPIEEGLTDNIKGEVTSSKHADLNEAVRMAHKLIEQKSQARDARILEGKREKWESLQSENGSAMVIAPTDGKLPLCERCFTRHVGQCTIKCHKCGKVGHKVRYCKEKSVATGANAQPVWTCYDCDEQGPNMITGTFLLNNQYASILFDSDSDKSFVNTRFSSLLGIKPIKIEDSYEVELVDGGIVSTNIVLKGCTLNLVNHIFEIDLMPIELGMFDVIIGMDWLVKHDAVIVCGEKVVRIPYGNKTLIVEGDKGVSRLKVISCIKARKYVERGCHLFLAHATENKSKEKQMEYVPVIRDFPEVFPEELPGLPPPRQVEFRIDLVLRVPPVALLYF